MRAFVFALLACIAWLGLATAASADWSSYIYVHSGPDGEIRISTPWGDYAAYDEGGGYYWVGTQREFDRQRVIAISRESGERLSLVNANGADATFVAEGTLRARVGQTTVDSFSPTILFGAEIVDANNRKAVDYRLVDFSWIQSGGPMPQVYIYSPQDQGRYQAGPSSAAGQGWYHTQVAVRKKDLTRRVAIILIVPNATPQVLDVGSIARLEYDVEAKQARSLVGMGIPVSRDTKKELANLIALDPSISLYDHPKPTAAVPQPTPRASAAPESVAAEHTPSSFTYTGSISDGLAGKGEMTLTLTDNGYGYIAKGTWSASFSNPEYNNDGTIAGYMVAPGYGTSFYLESARGGCAYHVLAQITPDGGMSARYKGVSCNNGGSFALTPGAEARGPGSTR